MFRPWISCLSWMLYLALLWFHPAPLQAQTFVDITQGAGLAGVPMNPFGLLGRGACAGDFDGDGDQDLIVPGGPSLSGGLPFYYFRNDGQNTFTDLTTSAGLGLSADAKKLLAGDVDNDGDLDLFVANNATPDQLFINNGSGVFVEEGALRGVASPFTSFAATFGDFDRDGWLDLYVGARHSFVTVTGVPNTLYHNNGNGFFTDVSAQAGVANMGFTLAAAFMDYNQDNWPDIIVANDKGSQPGTPPMALYENNHDGTFTDVSGAVGAQLAIDGMGVDFGDVFNRGEVDFFVTDLPPDDHFMSWNPQLGIFEDRSAVYGLTGGFIGWGCHFMDYDNDGWQDLWVVNCGSPNYMFKNPGTGYAGGAWPDNASTLGLTMPQALTYFSSVVADFDDDGRLDIYHVRPFDGNILTRNQVQGGNWLKIVTRGTQSNRDGIGARVSITAGSNVQTQWVRAGVGYVSESDLRLNFGLGGASQASEVRILWPSGQEQLLTGVGANQILTVVEPELKLQQPPVVGTAPTLLLSVPGDAGLPYLVLLSTGTSPGYPLGGGRVIPANQDWLLQGALAAGYPAGNLGNLSVAAHALLSMPLPNSSGLVGFTAFATAFTVDLSLPEVVRTILQPLSITLQ